MLDASGYGCLADHMKGKRHPASSFKFVNVHFPDFYILLYLVAHDCDWSASITVFTSVYVFHLFIDDENSNQHTKIKPNEQKSFEFL